MQISIYETEEPGPRKQRKVIINEDTTTYKHQISLQKKEEETSLRLVRHKQESPTFTQLKSELQQTQSVQYRSQRERFGQMTSSQEQSPLPSKFNLLLDKFKQIDYNLWKKTKLIVHSLDLFRVRQMLTLDSTLFKITKIDSKKIELQLPQQISENINPYPQGENNGPISLPLCILNRQKYFRNILEKIIQTRHDQYISDNHLEFFLPLSKSLKIFHSEFNLEDIEEIIPKKIQGIDQFHDKEFNNELKKILTQIKDFYAKRGVSFMFKDNVLKHIGSDNIKLQVLMQLLPDIIRLRKENQQILQLNLYYDIETLYKRLEFFML